MQDLLGEKQEIVLDEGTRLEQRPLKKATSLDYLRRVLRGSLDRDNINTPESVIERFAETADKQKHSYLFFRLNGIAVVVSWSDPANKWCFRDLPYYETLTEGFVGDPVIIPCP